ncbi:zinc finger protein 37-like isoform X3 [Xiphophorus couchianus]|uniref:zinc finger protein 37-like isoform X3 n=1 Tax=Xiphophorus couchianus TaxID=32473 RepID=UPI00101652A7|nr:zinc finger protein 37-like isoform X3 [Xiphophorus couchianus]
MSSAQHLRDFIRERLTAAAQEIFTEVEKTIICYEEELDAQRRMMGINWKPEIKLHRVGSELQRQSSDLQQPSVSNEEEAPGIQQVWSLAIQSNQDQKEAEDQWTEEVQMEPEPKRIKKEENKPEPTLLNHEEIEYPLIYVRKEELDSSGLQLEQQPPEHLPTGQDQKDLCSSQEGEQLVQKEAEPRMMGINWKPQIKLHRIGSALQRQSSDLQQPSVSNEEEAPGIQQVWSLAIQSNQDQKEAEDQWTEEVQMEPEPKRIKKEENKPEPTLLNHEEIEYPLIYVRKEELDSSGLQLEQQPPEHLPTGQDQKDLCSSQEGEQLVQKEAEPRMMGINWKPQIKLHRIGSALQRQSSDLQQPSVSNEEEASAIQQVSSLASRSSQDQKEAEHQWTEEVQMESEPKWIKEEGKEPEPALLNHEEIEYPLKYVRKEELDSSVLQHEQQPPERLPTGQDQKNLCSSQEGEQLVQKQFAALIQTSTLQEDDTSEEERTEQLSLHISPVIESKNQEGSSSSESESQSGTSTKNRSFKCDVCGICYTRQWMLKKHYRTHTGENISCETCGKGFSQICDLKIHKKIHTDLQQPSVSNEEEASAIKRVWSLASRSSYDQKQHQWTEEEHMEPEPKWIKKEEEEPEPALLKHEEIEYPLTYVRKEELESSVLQHEQQQPEHLPTGQDQKNLCSSQEGEQLVQKQFAALIETSTLQEDDMNEEERRTEQLSLHISPVTESKDQEGSSSSVSESQSDTCTKKRSFKCDICGRCYTRQYKLKNHYKTHTGERPFSCEICGKSFSLSYILKCHKTTHTGEKPFSCQSCGKSFSRIGNLKDHKRIHTGEKPFSCQSCGKSFCQMSILSRHKKIHTGEKPFSCESCGKSFSLINYLNDHKRTHTGEKPFSCQSCGKSFCQMSILSRHKKIHTGEKPFSCQSCRKSFSRISHLNRHKKIHTGEKLFSCQSCEKSFNRRDHLVIHMKTHTGQGLL